DQRLGGRLLRAARRGAPRRVGASGRRLPGGRVRGLGGRGAERVAVGSARGARAQRRRARSRGGRAGGDAAGPSAPAPGGRWRGDVSTSRGSTPTTRSA